MYKTSKGRELIIYENNEFNLRRRNKTSNVWICSLGGHNKNLTNCPAMLKTNLTNSQIIMKESMVSHNHLPHMEKIEKRKLMSGIKDSAEKARVFARVLY